VARLVRLDKVRGLARLYADQRPGGTNAFVPDTGTTDVGTLNDVINLAGTELWDLLVAARGESYYDKTATISIVGGTSVYSLPADFYQLRSLQLEWTTQDHEPVDPLESLEERPAFVNWGVWGSGSIKAYRLLGSATLEQIEIVPVPTTAVTARLYYTPCWTDLTTDAQTFNGVNGWEDLIALKAAMKLRAIEEQPFADLVALYMPVEARIQKMAADRASSAVKRVRQVYPEGGARGFFIRRRPLP
jgi:hypothetical protein